MKKAKQLEIRWRIVQFGMGQVITLIKNDLNDFNEVDSAIEVQIEALERANLCYLELVHKHHITNRNIKKAVVEALFCYSYRLPFSSNKLSIDLQQELYDLFMMYH